MGVALPSLAMLAKTQNLEAPLLPGPFFPFFVLSCCLCFFCFLFFAFSFFFLLISIHETVDQGADHGTGAG